MKETIRDFQHALLMGLSTGGNAILGFVAGVLLVRALSPEEYGLMSAAVAVILVTQEFVGRGINDGLIRLGNEEAAGSIERVVDIFRAGLALKGLFCLVVVALFLLIPGTAVKMFGFPELKKAFPAVVAAVIGFGFWSYLLSWHQARLDFGRLALIQPIYNLLRISLYLSMMIYSTLRWVPAIWFMAGSYLISVAIAGAESWRMLSRTAFDMRRFKSAFADLWRCSGWGMLAAFAFVALSRMDILVLTHHAETRDVALYGAAWQMLLIIDLGTITIMTVMIPKVAHCESIDDMLPWMGRTLLLGLTGAILTLPLFLLARWYVPLFLGSGYAASVTLVRIMYWGNLVALISSPLVGILHARQLFHVIAVIQILLLAVSVPAYTYATRAGGIVEVAWTNLGLRSVNAVIITLCAIVMMKRSTRKIRTEMQETPISAIEVNE